MTTTPWERFGNGPWSEDTIVPQTPPDTTTCADMGLPRTLRPVPGDGVVQRPVSDPAVKHHTLGMRLSEPQFADARTGEAWFAARRHALDLALAAVAGSEWAEHLVLRGSMLLKAWFGEAAREPGDLDFVVVPHTWQLDDERTDPLLDGIARAAEALSREAGSPVRIDAAGAVSDEIWTYDRVPGRRLVLPWTAASEGVPPGTVQLDFVFNEQLAAPAVRTEVPRHGTGESAVLMAASPALSLVWKIQWLVSDHNPEAKDLYDAVLLAESTPLPFELLRDVLYAEGHDADLPGILAAAADADWFEFRKDRPGLPGEVEHSALIRLAVALAPSYAPAEEGAYAQLAAAFEDVTSFVRDEHEAGGMEAVEEWFAKRSVPALCAVVAVRELLGRDRCTLREAAEVLLSFRDRRWGRDKAQYEAGRGGPREVAARLEAADAGR